MIPINKKSIVVLLCLLFASCDGKKDEGATPFYEVQSVSSSDENEKSSDDDFSSVSEVDIPFEEKDGIKTIKVELNGVMTVDMILDSGCSTTLISIAEANYLYNKGVLTQSDFLGESRAKIANGSIVSNMVFNLREIIIGGKISCRNVEVMVSPNAQSGLLLGNEVLNRVASYTIDNVAGVVHFELKE